MMKITQTIKNIFAHIAFIAVMFFSIGTSHAAPESDLLPQWKKSNENNTAVIDHSLWQQLLDTYVVTSTEGINLVDYATLIEKDSSTLNTYIDQLKSIEPRNYSLDEQFAYWVNLYNSATVLLITQNYPVESITKIKNGLFSFGPWDREWIDIAGETLSLNDIEHRILRPIWNDNRIHYAVNCASISCPNLSKQAFTGTNTEELLENLAQSYINHPRGVNIVNGKMIISSIYDWYAVDFNQEGSNLLEHISKYANPDLSAKLKTLENDNYKHDYDWNLNEAS